MLGHEQAGNSVEVLRFAAVDVAKEYEIVNRLNSIM